MEAIVTIVTLIGSILVVIAVTCRLRLCIDMISSKKGQEPVD